MGPFGSMEELRSDVVSAVNKAVAGYFDLAEQVLARQRKIAEAVLSRVG